MFKYTETNQLEFDKLNQSILLSAKKMKKFKEDMLKSNVADFYVSDSQRNVRDVTEIMKGLEGNYRLLVPYVVNDPINILGFKYDPGYTHFVFLDIEHNANKCNITIYDPAKGSRVNVDKFRNEFLEGIENKKQDEEQEYVVDKSIHINDMALNVQGIITDDNLNCGKYAALFTSYLVSKTEKDCLSKSNSEDFNEFENIPNYSKIEDLVQHKHFDKIRYNFFQSFQSMQDENRKKEKNSLASISIDGSSDSGSEEDEFQEIKEPNLEQQKQLKELDEKLNITLAGKGKKTFAIVEGMGSFVAKINSEEGKENKVQCSIF